MMMKKIKAALARLFSYPVVRHIVAGVVIITIQNGSERAGLDPEQARQLGNAAGEIVRTMPVEQ